MFLTENEKNLNEIACSHGRIICVEVPSTFRRFLKEEKIQKKRYEFLTVVNVINILRAAFAPIFLHQKITKPNYN